jgi:uncharacterized protein (DUF58 family)
MREGDDPRDVYWRKSTLEGQLVLRERARDTQRHVTLVVESTHTDGPPDESWLARFERRIRDAASRSVAHLRRGDSVTLVTTAGDRVRADKSVGADPVLRLLALLQPSPAPPRALPVKKTRFDPVSTGPDVPPTPLFPARGAG